MNKHISIKKHSGMSIVELMVAVAISALLLAGTVTIFINNKQTYEVSDDLSRLQENARFAMNFITQDVRMAGYFGCASQTTPVNSLDGIVAGSGVLLDISFPMEGLDASNVGDGGFQPSDNNIEPATITANTDAITIRFLYGQKFNLTASMTSAADDITIAANSGLAEGDIIGVADCNGTDIIQITNDSTDDDGVIEHEADGDPGNTSDNLSKIYEAAENAFVSRLNTIRYYIAPGAYGGPSLWRQVLGNDAGAVSNKDEEMVPGIENMQILYGIDTDSDGLPNDYDNASQLTAAEWDQVVSVRVGILARTTDTYGTTLDNQRYNLFSGATGCTVDTAKENEGCVNTTSLAVRRRVFSSTIVMRNL